MYIASLFGQVWSVIYRLYGRVSDINEAHDEIRKQTNFQLLTCPYETLLKYLGYDDP